jgi:uncharacterized membrane protein
MTASTAWATAARALLIFAGLSPLLSALARDLPVIGALARGADVWFAFQCERDAARALPFAVDLPVCSRCFGIYAGLGLGAALLRPRLSPAKLRLWVALAAMVMVFDVATEFLGMRPPFALFRFATGFGLAYPVGAALVWALRARVAS